LRLGFVDFLKNKKFDFDLFGRGINPIDDKFDALYPYKYSIGMENGSYKHYWGDKIADCFLSWTMPIYWGCPNIKDYFPEDSYILIDPAKPEKSLDIIKEAVSENKWEKNLDAIKCSRDLILNKYQFFPFISNEIKKNLATNTKIERKEKFLIPGNQAPWEINPSLVRKAEYKFRKFFNLKPF
jgi:hypothetical protein